MDYSALLKKASKDWNCPDMMTSAKLDIPKIPFSAPMMNYATYGGIPRNRITEFFGDPGCGKSSTAIDIAKNAYELFVREHEEKVQEYRQLVASGKKEYAGPLEDLLDRGPKKILYGDIEHGFDYKWAANMGITEDEIDVMQPPDVPAEDILNMVESIIRTGECGLFILDSIPTLVPKAELEKKIGERTVAALAGTMTVFLRKIVPLLTRYDCTILLINQTRPNMDNPYTVNTPGGQAVKFYSSLRILFRKGHPIDFVGNELPMSATEPSGFIINAKLEKQKCAANDRKAGSYILMTHSGVRPDYDYAKLAITKYGIIKKAGGWFTFCNPATGEILEDDGKPIKVNGQIRVYDYLKNNPEYYACLKEYIDNDINGTEPEEVESEDTDDLPELEIVPNIGGE